MQIDTNLATTLGRLITERMQSIRTRLDTLARRVDGVERRELESGTRIGAVGYRGVFKVGESYRRGEAATWDGSVWIAQKVTEDRPGTSDSWKLAVKRGVDGKVGPMPRHRWNGTRLQFEQGPYGDTWGQAVDLQGPVGGGTTVVNTQSYWPQGWA